MPCSFTGAENTNSSELPLSIAGGVRARRHDRCDLQIRPESEQILRALPLLKEELEIIVELAAPGHFIPELPQWEERSRFIGREGTIHYFHYDFYAQALAKIERSHARDREDVLAMLDRGLIEPAKLEEFFVAIEPEFFRYPAIDPRSFRAAVERFLKSSG